MNPTFTGFVRRVGDSVQERQGGRGEAARAGRAARGQRHRRSRAMRHTGESPTLSHDEHKRVVESWSTRRAGASRCSPAVARTPPRRPSTSPARRARGAPDGALVVNPYYNSRRRRGSTALPHGGGVGRDPDRRLQHPEPHGDQRRDPDHWRGWPATARTSRRQGGFRQPRSDDAGRAVVRPRLSRFSPATTA